MTLDRRPSDEGQESPGASDLLDRDGAISAVAVESAEPVDPGASTRQLGSSARYVHAAFVGAALLVTYITGQVVALIWNSLAAWPVALQYVPQLVRYDESVRGDVGLVVGAIVGVITVVNLYRRPVIRSWANDVAAELTKVTWPDRDAVTNNTIIVIVASVAAMLYVAVLDRFWSFATGLIYAQ